MNCPICKSPVDEQTLGQPGSTFPFCSKRCRDVDLGRWLDGKYQIAVSKDELAADEEDELAEEE